MVSHVSRRGEAPTGMFELGKRGRTLQCHLGKNSSTHRPHFESVTGEAGPNYHSFLLWVVIEDEVFVLCICIEAVLTAGDIYDFGVKVLS